MIESGVFGNETDDFGITGPDLAASASHAALGRVRELLAAPAAGGLDEIARFTGITRRIAACLDIGADADAGGDQASAALEKARALVLMNTLRLTAGHLGEPAPAAFAEDAQKSGITG